MVPENEYRFKHFVKKYVTTIPQRGEWPNGISAMFASTFSEEMDTCGKGRGRVRRPTS